MTEITDIEGSDSESKGAVFMVQPEELPQYKVLRRVVDEVFLSAQPFIFSAVSYLEMEYGEEGVNKQLRSMLFQPPKRIRRGVKRADVLVPGRGAYGSGSGVSAAKNTQRQSKQKERCENRLMSLLFATVYDPETKQCRLVQGAPPLKLRRQDKNGLFRFVSNYTDVRLYLRNAMATILAGHTNSVKMVASILPPAFSVLPTLFILIGRTFSLVLYRAFTSRGNVGVTNPPGGGSGETAKNTLEETMEAIREYIITWERRNFTTDNPLKCALKACTDNELFNSISSLLRAMIAVRTPVGNEPCDVNFRSGALYGDGINFNSTCQSQGGRGCLLGEMCPKEGQKEVSASVLSACLEFVDAIKKCVSVTSRFPVHFLDEELNSLECHPSVWNNNCAISSLHRDIIWAEEVRTKMTQSNFSYDVMTALFVQNMQTTVARCWGAFGKSNGTSISFLSELQIEDTVDVRATIVELVFGGGVAATALFEREDEIIPICAKLRSKKGPKVLMMNETEEAIVNDGEAIPGEKETTEGGTADGSQAVPNESVDSMDNSTRTAQQPTANESSVRRESETTHEEARDPNSSKDAGAAPVGSANTAKDSQERETANTAEDAQARETSSSQVAERVEAPASPIKKRKTQAKKRKRRPTMTQRGEPASRTIASPKRKSKRRKP